MVRFYIDCNRARGGGRLDEAFINASYRSTPGPPQLLKRRVTFLPTYLQYLKTELCIEYVDIKLTKIRLTKKNGQPICKIRLRYSQNKVR